MLSKSTGPSPFTVANGPFPSAVADNIVDPAGPALAVTLTKSKSMVKFVAAIGAADAAMGTPAPAANAAAAKATRRKMRLCARCVELSATVTAASGGRCPRLRPIIVHPPLDELCRHSGLLCALPFWPFQPATAQPKLSSFLSVECDPAHTWRAERLLTLTMASGAWIVQGHISPSPKRWSA